VYTGVDEPSQTVIVRAVTIVDPAVAVEVLPATTFEP
jgi:hypothetical protein